MSPHIFQLTPLGCEKGQHASWFSLCCFASSTRRLEVNLPTRSWRKARINACDFYSCQNLLLFRKCSLVFRCAGGYRKPWNTAPLIHFRTTTSIRPLLSLHLSLKSFKQMHINKWAFLWPPIKTLMQKNCHPSLRIMHSPLENRRQLLIVLKINQSVWSMKELMPQAGRWQPSILRKFSGIH